MGRSGSMPTARGTRQLLCSRAKGKEMRPADSWISCVAPGPLPCSTVTVLVCLRRSINELGGVLVDGASRGYRLDAADGRRNSNRVLDDFFPLVLEIYGGGCGCASYRTAADCARLL